MEHLMLENVRNKMHKAGMFDYSKITPAGLKAVSKSFEKNKVTVKQIEANNKPARMAGKLTKKAVFIMEDGQRITMFFTDSGDVFRVKMNNTVLPIKNTDSKAKAIKEISGLLIRNAPKFKKALQKKLEKAEIDSKAGVVARKKVVNSKIADLKQEIKDFKIRHGEHGENLLKDSKKFLKDFENDTNNAIKDTYTRFKDSFKEVVKLEKKLEGLKKGATEELREKVGYKEGINALMKLMSVTKEKLQKMKPEDRKYALSAIPNLKVIDELLKI